MDFTKKEFKILFKALKIMEHGEVLLGIDVDEEVLFSLSDKISKEIEKNYIKEVDGEVDGLVKEAMALPNNLEYNMDIRDFDDVFEPAYPHSETLKIL